jgi:hypothetical protein
MLIATSLSRLTVSVASPVDPGNQVELLVFREDGRPVAFHVSDLSKVSALATQPWRL